MIVQWQYNRFDRDRSEKGAQSASNIPGCNQKIDHFDGKQSKMINLFTNIVYALFVIHAGVGFPIARKSRRQSRMRRRFGGSQMSSCYAKAA
jgi:hypothetical protein